MPIKIIPMEDQVVVRSEEQVRESVISEYGFDADADVERIDKLVAKELDHDKKLSSAIGAKIKHRTEAEELKKKIPVEIPSEGKKEDQKDLTSKDTIALINAKVSEEDIDDVVEYAKFKGVSVAEALKSSVIKATLAEKAEFRKTAEVTNTNSARKVSTKTDGDTLVKNLHSKGEIPEKGSKDAEELFWAKRGGKK